MAKEQTATEKDVRIKEFLKEYEALIRKHNIIVSGCGCCGSPYLLDLSPDLGRQTIEDAIEENLNSLK